jgi:hypothetical protein
MTIFVSIEDEDGEQLDKVLDIESIQKRFPRTKVDGGSCLRFVDEKGDTAFNRLQLGELVEELASLESSLTQPQEKKELDALLGACRKATGIKGAYLKFYAE